MNTTMKKSTALTKILKFYKSKLEGAKAALTFTNGRSRLGHYDVGYYQGCVDLLERFKSKKKASV